MSKKLLKFLILFDNENLLYFPGQFINGRVVIELEAETPVLGLFFHIVGEGVVNLSVRKGRFYDKENYIDFRMRLLGEPGEDAILLSPGIHSFPFKLGLPLGLPSTFLGTYGWVQYYCKAALKELGGLIHKNQHVFIVMNPIDLNLEPPMLADPFHCEISHSLGTSCWKPGEVNCHVRLDKGGYVPGESVRICATITNCSKVSIKRTKASLSETVQYMAQNRVMETEVRELNSLSKGKIRRGEVAEWKDEQLRIPPLPPTNLRGCHVIRIQYDVFFSIEPKNVEKVIKLQLPILVATYPNRNSDGTLKRHQKNLYPATLPVFR